LGLDKFYLEVVEVGVVESEATLQGTIRDAALMLQEGNGLLQDIGEFHPEPFLWAWGITAE
jgi:hypothetical protein